MALVVPRNGMISYSPDMTAPYSVDTMATYSCNDGYRFVAGEGDQTRTCEEDGAETVSGATFSGTAPSCERVGKLNCTHWRSEARNEVAS